MAVPPTVPVPALYVGDLHGEVTDADVFALFSTVGALTTVRVCRDSATGRSLGYGYVNYISAQDAKHALVKLNHSVLNGKPIRIMWSHRDPDARNSGVGNLFVKNLSDSISNAWLHQMFGKFGTILSCKVATDDDGNSRGYGFVQFDKQESAESAIEALNGTTVAGKQIYVGTFIKKSERVVLSPEAKYTNLYMKNLDQDITEELIELKFSEFGKISNVKIAKDDNGNSKGFGFVNFESPDSAKRAVEAMNGVQLGSKTLYVARAQKKAERRQILRHLYEEKRNEQIRKSMASNVYVKNIDDTVDDDALRERFSQCGSITSAKIMRDDKGISKGFGFVCFSTPEEANKAVNTLHGCMFYGKPLYVAIAQRKEERQAQLQLQYAQRMAGLTGSSTAVMPAGYPHLYYTPPGVVPQIPPRQGLVYQPFGLSPGWRPSGFVPPSGPAFQPMPLPVMPNTPRQHRQNRGRMNGPSLPQSGHPVPYLPHMQRANHLNSSKDSNSQQRFGQTKYVPNGRQREMNHGSMVPPGAPNLQGTMTLSSMLAAATPQQQKQMLGERLFPLVEKLKFDLAAKITGMLLEMDNSELLLLLESPESLAAKVEEAVEVLKLSKTNVGGQESLHPNYFSNEVAVN
ncbi:polyadenylate-binding protein 7 [Elaeis guineensis]|uniref:Polyadenylate-binding protein n=1 Tax=Elaeis guineensis var. tenera TaxID=51953 RepID=A0A6I9RVK7_ELAGV|nr:polyadenylate-binding protein 7 [Elaeis guineensis]